MGLERVDRLAHAVDHHRPTYDDERCRGYPFGPYQRGQTYEHHHRGHHPVEQPYAHNLPYVGQTDKLVGCRHNQDEGEDIGDACNECGGHQRQYHSQRHAAQPYDGEYGAVEVESVAVGVIHNHALFGFAVGVVGCHREHARQEEHHAYQYGYPSYRLFVKRDEQQTHDDGDERAELRT